MSKVSRDNKKAELKGKKQLTANAKKSKKTTPKTPTKSAEKQLPNYGKCCTCSFYGKPCRKSNAYVPRKAEHPECYKCKEA